MGNSDREECSWCRGAEAALCLLACDAVLGGNGFVPVLSAFVFVLNLRVHPVVLCGCAAPSSGVRERQEATREEMRRGSTLSVLLPTVQQVVPVRVSLSLVSLCSSPCGKSDSCVQGLSGTCTLLEGALHLFDKTAGEQDEARRILAVAQD